MDNVTRYFKDLFEAIQDYRKKVIILFLIKNNEDLINFCGILKNDIIHLILLNKLKKS